MTVTEPAPADAPLPPVLTREEGRWTHQWAELVSEVVDTGLCTGCSACVIACPHDVLGYEHREGGYRPFHLEDELGPKDCTHGQKGCTSCTRACPRFRDWEPTADEHLFGRVREKGEISGISEEILLVRAADDHVHEIGQDGGLVSAILIWLLDEGYIDGALVSNLEGDGSTWRAKPGVATNAEEVLAAAGSRYTYSANWLAYDEARERGLEKLALVGMGCQTSASPTSYGDKVETAFMDGCTKRLADDQAKSETSVGKPIDVCRCAYDALSADKGGVDFDRIKAVNDDLTEKPGPLPDDVAKVVADCA